MKIDLNAARKVKQEKPKGSSRLKKKLSIYFILIAIVSISVSLQIILEVSSPNFQNKIRTEIVDESGKNLSKEEKAALFEHINLKSINVPIADMRNRILLMMLVVSVSIIGAFTMFTRDIVEPMDQLVEATQKIASGDLSAHVPVKSDDEIGQMANLVNDMNISLQDMIKQMRRELDNYNVKLAYAINQLEMIGTISGAGDIIEQKRLKLSDFKKMLETQRDVERLLQKMCNDIMSLYSFMDTYKTYSISSDVTQREIDETLAHYKRN